MCGWLVSRKETSRGCAQAGCGFDIVSAGELARVLAAGADPARVVFSGVGKTAVVEGLAQRIIAGDVPETLKNKQLVSLDLGAMVAGAPMSRSSACWVMGKTMTSRMLGSSASSMTMRSTPGAAPPCGGAP